MLSITPCPPLFVFLRYVDCDYIARARDYSEARYVNALGQVATAEDLVFDYGTYVTHVIVLWYLKFGAISHICRTYG